MEVTEVLIDDVDISQHHRKELGDIEGLSLSIAKLDLLHPIVLGPNKRLISGRRRLEACRLLGNARIKAHYARSLSDLAKMLEAERDENTCRKDLSPSEMVSLAVAIKEAYKPKATAKKQAGPPKNTPLPDDGEKVYPSSERGGKRDESSRTESVAAKAVGVSRPTLRKATAVVESGDKDLVAEMDRTGNVSAAYRKVREPKPKSFFDDTKIEELIKKLPRLFDDRANFYGVKEGKHHRACRNAGKALWAAWKEWKKDTPR